MSKIGNYTHGKLEHVIKLFIEKHQAPAGTAGDPNNEILQGGGTCGTSIKNDTITHEGYTYKISLCCPADEYIVEGGQQLTITEDADAIVIPCEDTPDLLGVSEILAGDAIRIDNATSPRPTVNVQFHHLDDPTGGLASSDKVLVYDASETVYRKAAISDIVSSVSGDPASKSEPYVTIGNSSALSHERALAATSNTGITLTDGGANGSATLAIDINSATDAGNSYSVAGDDLILIADSANSNTVKKLKMSLFTGGDVKAGSAFSTDNVLMVCNGTAKTVDLPDTTITTNGQGLEVQGVLTVADTDGNDILTITPDYEGSSQNADSITLDFKVSGADDAVFQADGTDLFKITGGGRLTVFPTKILSFEHTTATNGGAIDTVASGTDFEIGDTTYSSGAFRVRNFSSTVTVPVIIQNNSNMADGVILAATGGTSSTIKINNTLGTSAASIDLISGAGGITLNADEGITVTSKGSAPSSTSHKIYNHSGDLYWAGNKLTVGTTTITSQNDTDNRIAVFGGTTGGSKIVEGISGFTHDGSTFTATATNIDNVSNRISFGTDGSADVITTYKGGSNDGVLTWSYDDDRFEFSDDVFINSDEKMFFRETGTYIQSGASNKLKVNTTTEIDLTSETIALNADAVNHTLDIGTSATTFPDFYDGNIDASGDIIKFLNTTTTKGVVYYLDDNSGSPRWAKVDPDADGTGEKELLAIALGTNSNSNGMLTRGYVRINSGNYEGTASAGAPLYLYAPGGTATGKLTFTTPSSSGNIIRIAGHCILKDGSDNILVYFNPSTEWIERA